MCTAVRSGGLADNTENKCRTAYRLGVVAESLPAEVLDESDTCVNLGAYSSMLHAAVKELNERTEAQAQLIKALEARLAALEQRQQA